MGNVENKMKEQIKDDHKSSNPQIISLINLLKKGIVYEEVPDFENSIYENVYTWAKEAVEQITADSREKEKYRKRSTKGKNTETSNVISFVGRRGTGKSSAMLSFQEALRKYKGNGKDECMSFNEDAEMDNVRFFPLDCIDAAAMEKSESVFTLVLANILSKIEEHNTKEHVSTDSYLMRSLLQKLGKIYKDYSSLTMQHSEAGVYSAYENLRNAASSQRIRTQFEQLVRECLQYFQQDNQYSAQEAYLVIAIDDLDMAHYNERATAHGRVNMRSYEIMREISKYFSIPGVIVLAAYNHTNLQRQCSGFFIGSNSDYYRQIHQKIDTLRSGETLAAEFMEKTFASAYRLYMPSWKKWDYFNQNIRIDIGREGEKDDLFERFRQKKKYVFKIKDLLKILYAEKTGVYYDCEGKKRHFLEADSLRALNSTLYLLIGEDALRKNKLNHLHIVKENRRDVFKRVMDDVYFRFVNERLYLEEEKSLFYDLLELQIDRRSERIVQLVAPKIDPLGKNIKHELQLLYEDKRKGKKVDAQIAMLRDNSNVAYSYAELLHCIYHMTRTGNIYTKEFVACLLHSYSVCLTQIYDRYRTAKLGIEPEHYQERYRYHQLENKKEEKNEALQSEQDDNEKNSFDTEDKYQYLWCEENYAILDKTNKAIAKQKQIKSDDAESNKQYLRIDINYEILKGVIGKSIFGYWTQYYFPIVSYFSDEKLQVNQIFSIGSFDNIRDSNFHVEFKIEDENSIKTMLNVSVFIMTFYIDLLQWNSIQIDYTYKKFTDEIEMVILQYNEQSNFELTSFVKWSILYPDYLYKMEQLLTEAFDSNQEDNEKVIEFQQKVRVCIRQLFKELWDCYYEWDHKYGGMILPIHNMDLMYNLVKHLFLEHEQQNDHIHVLNENNSFLDEFSNMLQRILIHLHEIDKFYCLSGEDSFVEKFQNCPYIKLLGSIKKQDESKNLVEEYIKYIFVAVSNNCINRLPSDDKY